MWDGGWELLCEGGVLYLEGDVDVGSGFLDHPLEGCVFVGVFGSDDHEDVFQGVVVDDFDDVFLVEGFGVCESCGGEESSSVVVADEEGCGVWYAVVVAVGCEFGEFWDEGARTEFFGDGDDVGGLSEEVFGCHSDW